MNRPRRLVERVSGLEQTRRLTVDRELVCALEHVSERVVAGVAVRRAGEPRRPVDDAYADFSSRQIREWLRDDLLNAGDDGLRGGGRDERGAVPRRQRR